MKPFRFRLETLLDFRKMQKEESQIVFLKASNQLRAEKTLLKELEDKVNENIESIRSSEQESLTIEKLKVFRYYFDKLTKDVATQKECIAKAEEYCQKCLEELAEFEKKYKIVEKFREKKLENYQLEAIQEEQKLLDEIGIQLYTREK